MKDLIKRARELRDKVENDEDWDCDVSILREFEEVAPQLTDALEKAMKTLMEIRRHGLTETSWELAERAKQALSELEEK